LAQGFLRQVGRHRNLALFLPSYIWNDSDRAAC
jgi:hypothetical protein